MKGGEMSSYEERVESLEELDTADREAIEAAEAAILHVIAEQHPTTLSQLSEALAQAQLGEVDRSVIRAAILRLLNENRLEIGSGHQVPAGG
jgi:hypothetical protein